MGKDDRVEKQVEEIVDDEGNASFQLTVYEDSARWLLEQYPDARDIQEAVRHALGDARLIRGGDSIINDAPVQIEEAEISEIGGAD